MYIRTAKHKTIILKTAQYLIMLNKEKNTSDAISLRLNLKISNRQVRLKTVSTHASLINELLFCYVQTFESR
jgi:hypothetical protein